MVPKLVILCEVDTVMDIDSLYYWKQDTGGSLVTTTMSNLNGKTEVSFLFIRFACLDQVNQKNLPRLSCWKGS